MSPVAGQPSPATDFSIALLDQLVARGLRHVVLAPGSRSQALALAAAELERLGVLSLTVRLDERVAAFTAIGLAVETRMPVAVITTSGTAVGNLLPAVMEAHHSGVPLIVLSADRPAELRGTGSNQTTLQPGIFSGFVRLECDVEAPGPFASESRPTASSLAAAAAAAALGASAGTDQGARTGTGLPGPVHLNLQFREPLSGPFPSRAGSSPRVALAPEAVPAAAAPTGAPVELGAGPRTVVVAGHGAGPEAEEIAREAGWPLLAEVSSGARFGPNLVAAYRELLADPDFGARVERVVVFGHPTLSREVPALLGRRDVETIVVVSGGEAINPGHAARRVVDSVVVGSEASTAGRAPDGRAWLGRWVMASRRLLEGASADAPAPDVDASRSTDPRMRRDFAEAEFAVFRQRVTRTALALALWRATWPHDRLVLGASRLIREVDRVVPGKKIRVHANRGLSGIDGTVSTAIGMALASQNDDKGGVTRVLLGDLTLLHDVGGLLIGDGETRPRIQVVVGNDGGGTIFDSLEVSGTADPDAFSRVMRTPQSVDLERLAAAYGWAYTRAATRSDLDRALTSPVLGPGIIEVPLSDSPG